MCGRYSHKLTWKQIRRLAGLTTTKEPPLTLRYNVAPTQNASVIREIQGERRLDQLRWGLIPSWAKEPGAGQTIARAETVATKATFRAAFKQRRCLIPASGFYEWEKLPGKDRKQPYHIQLASEEPLFFGGVWETWTPPDGGEPVESYAMITTEPNEMMAKIHDRMPVIIDPKDFATWLSPAATPEVITGLMKPFPAELMMAHAVSTYVNSPRNEDERCIESVDTRPEERGLFDG